MYCKLKNILPKILFITVVPNLFATADRSTLDNLTAAREFFMMVVVFQQATAERDLPV